MYRCAVWPYRRLWCRRSIAATPSGGSPRLGGFRNRVPASLAGNCPTKIKGVRVNSWFKVMMCVTVAAGGVWGNVASADQPAQSAAREGGAVLDSIQGKTLSVTIGADGGYSVTAPGIRVAVVRSGVEADVDSRVLRSSAYPLHKTEKSEFKDEFGSGSQLTVTHTGLAGAPDLICTLRLYQDQTWGDINVELHNTMDRALVVHAFRNLHTTDAPVIALNGPATADRILSDSFSEDRPQLAIRELGDGPKGMHRAVGSQLIYNRDSGQSLFLGALTSDRLLTIFHLKERTAGGTAALLSYEAVASGTTEIMKGG